MMPKRAAAGAGEGGHERRRRCDPPPVLLDGGPLDYGIAVKGLHSLPEPLERSVMRRVRESEDGLVRVLLDRRNPDLEAVRREGYCRQ
jgi:hypothetical protein